MKTNAKEYLIEFANSQNEDWFKALIYSAVETNGAISSDKNNEIFKCLQDSTEIEYSVPNIVDSNSETEIVLTKLVHKKGVNALCEKQTIKFNDNVTILHGLNGTGKSGYFRILNEIVGGSQEKDILQNIYKDNPPEIDVEICYKESENQNTINWLGDTRSLNPLNKCKVFDTSYLNGLLEKRQNDTTLIQPLGLNIFSYLIEILGTFKERLKTNANNKKIQKPNIDLTHFSEEIQSVFQNHNLTETRREEIIRLFDFSDESAQKLEDLSQDLTSLRQVNIQDKITLLSTNKSSIEDLKEWLTQNHKLLSDNIVKVKELIDLKEEKQAKSNKAKEQYEVLKSVPLSDSKEWKDFIIAGQSYSDTLKNNKGVCPYCRQELQGGNSEEIIKAYGSFLKDNSERELEQVLSEVRLKLEELGTLSFEYEITKNTIFILKKESIKGKTIFDFALETITNYKKIKSDIIKLINENDSNSEISIIEITPLITKLNSYIEALKAQIDKYLQEDSEKKEKIKLKEQELKTLKENQAISFQKDNIEKWIKLTAEETTLREKADQINTIKLSLLSKKASNNLLTEALRELFKKELVNIGYPDLGVKMENAGTRKGFSSTKLVLTRNNAVKSILSEGEQKAVALALFIAEVKMQKQSNPIILDDPVNSLDHKIAGKFAERLLSLDNQIIIFNHNRLFLDSFETSKSNHICKTTDSDCNKSLGKHIKVYEVISQSKHMKGVLRNYKGNYAKNHIKEAKKLLDQVPFEDDTNVANLLRLSVECTIDEVIFNHQVPTRFSNKNSRIAWAELKNIKNDPTTINLLENIHGRVSGGQIHNGTERNENSIEVEEYKEMISKLEYILN